MQAITTKYIPATNFRGSRIKAQCSAGSVTVGYHDNDGNTDAFDHAAITLIKKLGWQDHGQWTKGELPGGSGSVYVCSPRHNSTFLNIV